MKLFFVFFFIFISIIDSQRILPDDYKEYDDYFYDHLDIADKYCFVTVLDGEPIGHISWDPRHKPDYVEIGHNCIITKYKGKGYGYFQLEELKNIMI